MTRQLFETFMEQHLDIEFGKGVQTGKHTQLSVFNNSNIYALYILENTNGHSNPCLMRRSSWIILVIIFFFKGYGYMGQGNCKVIYWFSCVTFEVSNKILARKPHLEYSSRK